MHATPMEMAPTPARERYEFLDVLRGTALFGIVSANMNGADELRGTECHLYLGILRDRTRARG